MANFRADLKTVLDKLLLPNPLIRPGKMFGYPAYYVGKKLCICLYEQGVGIKIPQKLAESFLEKDGNISPFQPMGKSKMREWVQINVNNSMELLEYQSLFEESIQYVISLQS
jgi:hypothetical protein